MFEIQQLKYRNILEIDNLKIEKEVNCILGPSGSGKTTLLKMLNKLYVPDSGSIYYKGEDIAKMGTVALRRRVVMLGQTPVLYGRTIRDNLLIGLELSQRPTIKDETILYEALERVALAKHLEESCATLSGGEKQRLCLARIMLLNAETYLLDEPSSALDSGTEEFITESLAKFAQENQKQLILVTHSQKIAEKYHDSMIVIENGHVKEEA